MRMGTLIKAESLRYVERTLREIEALAHLRGDPIVSRPVKVAAMMMEELSSQVVRREYAALDGENPGLKVKIFANQLQGVYVGFRDKRLTLKDAQKSLAKIRLDIISLADLVGSAVAKAPPGGGPLAEKAKANASDEDDITDNEIAKVEAKTETAVTQHRPLPSLKEVDAATKKFKSFEEMKSYFDKIFGPGSEKQPKVITPSQTKHNEPDLIGIMDMTGNRRGNKTPAPPSAKPSTLQHHIPDDGSSAFSIPPPKQKKEHVYRGPQMRDDRLSEILEHNMNEAKQRVKEYEHFRNRVPKHYEPYAIARLPIMVQTSPIIPIEVWKRAGIKAKIMVPFTILEDQMVLFVPRRGQGIGTAANKKTAAYRNEIINRLEEDHHNKYVDMLNGDSFATTTAGDANITWLLPSNMYHRLNTTFSVSMPGFPFDRVTQKKQSQRLAEDLKKQRLEYEAYEAKMCQPLAAKIENARKDRQHLFDIITNMEKHAAKLATDEEKIAGQHRLETRFSQKQQLKKTLVKTQVELENLQDKLKDKRKELRQWDKVHLDPLREEMTKLRAKLRNKFLGQRAAG